MAINVPMPELPGTGFLKGLDTGSNLFHKIMLSKYYNQLHPSGDVANAMYVEQLANQYGEDDPRTIAARQAHQMALRGKQSLMDYRDVLNSTAGIRATSPEGKILAEARGQGGTDIVNNRRNGGALPPFVKPKGGSSAPSYRTVIGTDQAGKPVYQDEVPGYQEGMDLNQPYDENEATDADNIPVEDTEKDEYYNRVLGKKTTDADARKKLLFAKNIDKTLSTIDVNDLTMYSGLKGTGEYLKDMAQQAMTGEVSDRLIRHQEALESASVLADQIRAFYGDSVQPSAMQRLRTITNPSTWYKHPKIATAEFNQLKKILDMETKTYKEGATSPAKAHSLGFDKRKGKFFLGNTPAAKEERMNAAPDTTPEGDLHPGEYYDVESGQWRK